MILNQTDAPNGASVFGNYRLTTVKLNVTI